MSNRTRLPSPGPGDDANRALNTHGSRSLLFVEVVEGLGHPFIVSRVPVTTTRLGHNMGLGRYPNYKEPRPMWLPPLPSGQGSQRSPTVASADGRYPSSWRWILSSWICVGATPARK
jgi:hypothetical protein